MQGDDYNHIMIEAIADRLAEAFAEKLHEIVRKEVWAYAPDENLSADDLLKVKYQGMLLLASPMLLDKSYTIGQHLCNDQIKWNVR